MGHAAGQPPHRLHLLGLEQLRLELLPLRLGLLALRDVAGGGIDEAAGRIGSPLDPAIRTIPAAIAVREIQDGLLVRESGNGIQGGLQVLGMDEVQEPPSLQFRHGVTQNGLPLRIQTAERAVGVGNAQEVQRHGKKTVEILRPGLQFFLGPLAVGNVADIQNDPLDVRIKQQIRSHGFQGNPVAILVATAVLQASYRSRLFDPLREYPDGFLPIFRMNQIETRGSGQLGSLVPKNSLQRATVESLPAFLIHDRNNIARVLDEKTEALLLSRSVSSIRLRSVISVWVPSMRSGRPRASRSTTRPRERIHFHSPDLVRWRNSTRYSGILPAI